MRDGGAKKYLLVYTNKVVSQLNKMGASKHIMELFFVRESPIHPISIAPFPKVAFLDSLLSYGFIQLSSRGYKKAAGNPPFI